MEKGSVLFGQIGLDSDFDPKVTKGSDYILNQSITEDGRHGVAVNMRGNQLVVGGPSNVYFWGHCEDKQLGRIIYFYSIIGSSTPDNIWYYDIVQQLTYPIIQDANFLNFCPYSTLPSQNILSTLFIEACVIGSYLIWNQVGGKNDIREINYIRQINTGYCTSGTSSQNAVTIELYKRPPNTIPIVSRVTSTSSINPYGILNKSYQFASLFIYNDNQTSVISQITDIFWSSIQSLPNGQYTIQDGTLYYNITLPTAINDVQYIQLLVRSNEQSDWYIYDNIYTPYSTTYLFDDTKVWLPIDNNLLTRPYDYIPSSAIHLDTVEENRLVIGGYNEGFDPTELNVNAITVTNEVLPPVQTNNYINVSTSSSHYFKITFGSFPANSVEALLSFTVQTTITNTSTPNVVFNDFVEIRFTDITGTKTVAECVTYMLSQLGPAIAYDSVGYTNIINIYNLYTTLGVTIAESTNSTPLWQTFLADTKVTSWANSTSTFINFSLQVCPASNPIKSLKTYDSYLGEITYYDKDLRYSTANQFNDSIVVHGESNYLGCTQLKIQVSIFNLPPPWAMYYSLGFSLRQSIDSFIQFAAQNIIDYYFGYDTFLYIRLQSIINYAIKNNNSNIQSYTFEQGDKIRIIGYLPQSNALTQNFFVLTDSSYEIFFSYYNPLLPNHIYIMTLSGMYQAIDDNMDNNLSWTLVTSESFGVNSVMATYPDGLAGDTTGFIFTQDSVYMFLSGSWQNVSNLPILVTSIAFVSNSILYICNSVEVLYTLNFQGQSTTWVTAVYPGYYINNIVYFNNLLYASTINGIFSTPNGVSWTGPYSGTSAQDFTLLTVFGTILLAACGNSVYYDNSGTWNTFAHALPSPVTQIATNGTTLVCLSGNTIYIYSAGSWISTNSSVIGNAITTLTVSANLIIAGTIIGPFSSLISTTTWAWENNIETLTQNPVIYDVPIMGVFYPEQDESYAKDFSVPSEGNPTYILDANGNKVYDSNQQYIKVGFTQNNYINVAGVNTLLSALQFLVFEIYKPKKSSPQQFYYHDGIYPISSGLHTGNVQNQTSGQPAILISNFGDTYIKIRDCKYLFSCEDDNYSDYYTSNFYGLGSVNIYDKFAKQQSYPNGIRWGGKALLQTKVNQINLFNFDDYILLKLEYGDITGMYQLGNELKILHQNEETSIYVGRTQMENADESSNVVYTNKVLGTINYLGYGNGSIFPRSVAIYQKEMFYLDVYRGEVIRSGQNGREVISNANMRAFFQQLSNLILNTYATPNFVDAEAGYDEYNKIYLLTVNGITINVNGISIANPTIGFYNAKIEGQSPRWLSFYSFSPQMYANLGTCLISFYQSFGYLHNSNLVSRGNFYGTQYGWIVNFYFNVTSTIKKIFRAITIKASSAWNFTSINIEPDATYTRGMQSQLPAGRFVVQEGEFSSNYLRNGLTTSPNVTTKDLMDGDELRGYYLKHTMVNNSTTEQTLLQAEITYEPSNNI